MKAYFDEYAALLKRELLPALGCTEPTAIAYAAALARECLGAFPERVVVACSHDVIKNTMSVRVPMAGELHGIEAAALMGLIGGDPKRGMEVLSAADGDTRLRARELLGTGLCRVEQLEAAEALAIRVTAWAGEHSAVAEIRGKHDHIARLERDGRSLCAQEETRDEARRPSSAYPEMDLERILDYAEEADLAPVAPVLERQVEYNLRIAEEGLKNPWGACVGRTLLQNYGDDVKNVARAWPAAGSDARMSGCVLPVVINSGSGNQGLTASLPVVKYAEYCHAPHERLLRALALSNLVAIYQKSQLGTLSAFCGAVCAAAGSGAGIAFLLDGRREVIRQTIVNTLADVSGIICDGAKPSCAAKIASAVDAAILGFSLAREQHGFTEGEGIVQSTADETCHMAMKIGREGMRETDRVILDVMLARR